MIQFRKLKYMTVFGLAVLSLSCEEDKPKDPVLINQSTAVSVDKSVVVEGGKVLFNDQTEGVVSRLWNFPGGNPSESTEAEVEVTYMTAGDYVSTVQLTFEDGSGKIARVPVDVVGAVVADFSAEPTTAIIDASVQFTDASTGEADTWKWIFEGGTPSTSADQNPEVTYAAEGVYDVTLIATRSDVSSVDTLVMEDYITVNSLDEAIISFTADETTIDAGGSVTYTNTTTGADTYQWTFEGGTPATSVEANPVVTYNEPGVYDVSLVAVNAGGAADTVVVDYIIVRELQPASVINDNGNFERFELDGDRLTIDPWREFVFAADGADGKVLIEFNGKSYAGGGGTFDLDESVTAETSYSGNAHYRLIQAAGDATDPRIDNNPADNAIQLEVGKTYRVSMMIKVLSSGSWTHPTEGDKGPAMIQNFGQALNNWSGLTAPVRLDSFTPNQWVEHTYTFECTHIGNAAVAFPVLRVRGECDILLDNVYLTEEP
ncbi:PKD domain-containing protein [Marinoscillum furvescens]|uniref:PKD repeat protein n=1 Tax=Marinoscillum furvescens DSM 4134 TaxID=1122208 RepID=A0A3D9L0N9_MARFU|nr:PKD domain-containing protein [Marinoscillum furvescens]RED96009.1 PKD repeat protein [Marinoscillum furvescens DSM 4134]